MRDASSQTEPLDVAVPLLCDGKSKVNEDLVFLVPSVDAHLDVDEDGAANYEAMARGPVPQVASVEVSEPAGAHAPLAPPVVVSGPAPIVASVAESGPPQAATFGGQHWLSDSYADGLALALGDSDEFFAARGGEPGYGAPPPSDQLMHLMLDLLREHADCFLRWTDIDILVGSLEIDKKDATLFVQSLSFRQTFKVAGEIVYLRSSIFFQDKFEVAVKPQGNSAIRGALGTGGLVATPGHLPMPSSLASGAELRSSLPAVATGPTGSSVVSHGTELVPTPPVQLCGMTDREFAIEMSQFEYDRVSISEALQAKEYADLLLSLSLK